MKIGIDVSQIAYEGTGVANLLKRLVENLLKVDKENEYILFASSLQRDIKNQISKIKNTLRLRSGQANQKVKIKAFKFPQTLLDIVWNRFHIIPVEWLIGDVDVFITSDWTEPPTRRAKKATILYDLIVCKTPHETDSKIVSVQRRKLQWVKKESDAIFCISESTKRDAMEILGIDEKRLRLIYPGA